MIMFQSFTGTSESGGLKVTCLSLSFLCLPLGVTVQNVGNSVCQSDMNPSLPEREEYLVKCNL